VTYSVPIVIGRSTINTDQPIQNIKEEEVKKPKSWNCCGGCGLKIFPKSDPKKMTGITVTMGTCPECNRKGMILIPIRDFQYASGDDSKWD